jgi:hypothetical protein
MVSPDNGSLINACFLLKKKKKMQVSIDDYHIRPAVSDCRTILNVHARAMCQWLTPVILTTWEAEVWRISVQGQS